jgi:hypothetical protein
MKQSKFLFTILLVSMFIILAGGCSTQPSPPPGPPPEPPPSLDDDPYYEDPYEDRPTITGNDINTNCGYFEGPCCEDFDIGMPSIENPTGVIYNTPPCEGDLECRADTCVEGPDYEAYDRNNPDYY